MEKEPEKASNVKEIRTFETTPKDQIFFSFHVNQSQPQVPVKDPSDAVDVILLDFVRDSVVEHDLDAAKLSVGRVHLSTEQLIQSRCTGQND